MPVISRIVQEEDEWLGIVSDEEPDFNDYGASEDDEDDDIITLAPPPPRLLRKMYNTFEELEAEVQAWAKTHGYCVRRGKGKKNNNNGRKRYWLECDKCDPPKETAAAGRGVHYRGCNYKFKGRATRYIGKDNKWQLWMRTITHNGHTGFLLLSVHLIHRRRTAVELATIHSMSRNKAVTASAIIDSLKHQFPGTLVRDRDIWNE